MKAAYIHTYIHMYLHTYTVFALHACFHSRVETESLKTSLLKN